MMIQVNVRLSRLGAEGTKLEVPNNDLAFYKTARRWPRWGEGEARETLVRFLLCLFLLLKKEKNKKEFQYSGV